MKKGYLALVFSVVACMVLSSCTTGQYTTFQKISKPDLLKPAAAELKVKSVNSTAVKELPIKELKVYEKTKIDAEAKLKELQKLYSLGEGKIEKDNGFLTCNGDKYTLTVNEIGGSYALVFNTESPDTEKAIDETAAVEQVKKFVRSKNIRTEELKTLKTGSAETTIIDPNGEKKKITSELTYYLTDSNPKDKYLSDAEPLEISINADGVITLVAENKTEKKEIGSYPLIDKNEAVNRLKKGEGVVTGTKESCSSVEISEYSVTYFNNGPISDAGNGILQPIINMSGTIDGDSSASFSAQIPALTSDCYKP